MYICLKKDKSFKNVKQYLKSIKAINWISPRQTLAAERIEELENIKDKNRKGQLWDIENWGPLLNTHMDIQAKENWGSDRQAVLGNLRIFPNWIKTMSSQIESVYQKQSEGVPGWLSR